MPLGAHQLLSILEHAGFPLPLKTPALVAFPNPHPQTNGIRGGQRWNVIRSNILCGKTSKEHMTYACIFFGDSQKFFFFCWFLLCHQMGTGPKTGHPCSGLGPPTPTPHHPTPHHHITPHRTHPTPQIYPQASPDQTSTRCWLAQCFPPASPPGALGSLDPFA